MTEDAKAQVRLTLETVRSFLALDAPRRLSEADTKANFLEPIISALGWQGIGQVTREYYVKSSGEKIDYLLSGNSGPVLAIEAKALQAELTEKSAAQLVQYCTVEGIEWAALTNARELQFFHTFIKGNLPAKRVLSLDVLAFNSDAEFDALFQQLWRLSRESLTNPSDVRKWVNRRRLDAALCVALLDPASEISSYLEDILHAQDIEATRAEIIQWVQELLSASKPREMPWPPPSVSPQIDAVDVPASVRVEREPDVNRSAGDQHEPPARIHAQATFRTKSYFGVTIRELITAGFLRQGQKLVLSQSGQDFATAEVAADGRISFHGRSYPSLSDKAFAKLLGRKSLNGWTTWYVEQANGRTLLADVRDRYLREKETRNQ